MRRRTLAAALCGVVALPAASRAQPADRVRRLGILTAIAADDHPGLAALREGLRALGWNEGRNLLIDLRSTDADPRRADALARELVERRPDVLVGHTLAATVALKKQTGTLPIVGVVVADPVGGGLVGSLARPDGNVTGFINFEPSIGGKWLELLGEVVPGLRRVGFMFNPATSTVAEYLRSVQGAAWSLGIEIVLSPVRSETEIEAVIGALGGTPGTGLIVPPDVFLSTHDVRVVDLAAKHRLPVMYAYRRWAARGGLMVYGIDPVDLFRRAAPYVDRLFKGAHVAELPMQYPTRFEFAINLRTAKALGITVPPTLLARADEVIE
ncbi:MAG: ABC transporter substrate-binding protein [Reyranella sp.]